MKPKPIMKVEVLKGTTKLGFIEFKFLRYRPGPFYSRAYIATLLLDGERLEEYSEETYPDYFNPLGNFLEDFGLKGGYTITYEEYLRARRNVVAGRSFIVQLYQHAIVKECR